MVMSSVQAILRVALQPQGSLFSYLDAVLQGLSASASTGASKYTLIECKSWGAQLSRVESSGQSKVGR